MNKINIIIVESDNLMFDRLKQDIRKFSPYINKIYRCSYHNDVYKIDCWLECKLIIAHNPEDNGLNFFKSFYQDQDIKNIHRIFGLIYTRGYKDEEQLYRIARFLYDWSQHLFIGAIFKNYGSLEKILEIIQNIAINNRSYPLIDCLHKQKIISVLDPSKLEFLRNYHNMKYKIFENLQPLMITVSEFNESKKKSILKQNLLNYQDYFKNFEAHYQQLQKYIHEFLKFEFHNQSKYQQNIIKIESSFYLKHLQRFISDGENVEPNLWDFYNILNSNEFNIEGIISTLVKLNNDGSIGRFLKNYSTFNQSLNRIIDLLDEQYFLR